VSARAAVIAVGLAAACATASAPRLVVPPSTRPITVDELVRLRCAHDGRQVLTTWTGTVYGYPVGAAPVALFDVVGLNVARCVRHDGAWHLTSRELMYYLAPGGERPLERWRNPWTDVEVPVVHVANHLVQARLAGGAPLTVADGRATVAIDVPLFYPNPLAADPAGGGPTYQGGEFFVLGAPAAELAAGPSVASLDLVWHRVGPWLPWMGQGDRPGYLLYRATGRKVGGLDELPGFFAAELERLPRFRAAPTCVVDERNVTSWTYFAAHREAYARGERFPVAAPVVDERCRD
jgi:hypothetical protein